MASAIAPTPCPKCGGQMWDNSLTKRSPRAPDYSCKNKQGCGGGVWITDSERNAKIAAQPVGTGGSRPTGNLVLDSMMNACMKSSQAILAARLEGRETVELVVNMATTLFIARTRGDGILKAEKPKASSAPAAPPPPPPPPPPTEPPPPEYTGDFEDDDLPF